jgi:hypothetical protein
MRSAEYFLREVIEIAAPRPAIVGVVIDVPDVWNVVPFQMRLDALGNVDEAVLVAAGKIEQLQFAASRGGIRNEFGGRLGVGSGRKAAHPREGVEVAEAKVKCLTAAHEKTGEDAVLAAADVAGPRELAIETRCSSSTSRRAMALPTFPVPMIPIFILMRH